ncbi:dihydroxyacetone kinase phosphoryl donor subunit DhaM [Georgenia sp. M64]|uniref:dihydroxyacetone kinase phosphoryl donor subunit DhaM n=1 Tax=Georgenia sp. M64 TaxID=3120520 RepID=UPI0030E336D6
MSPDGAHGRAVRTGIVVVSHSARLADGVVEVAAQMAPDVALRAAGGTDEGGVGTSFTKVEEAVLELLGAGEVVVLTDLGSATMTAESVLEMLDDDDRERVTLADGPLVEGTVAGAVAAQGGADAAAVARTAAAAAASFAHAGQAPPPEPADGGRTVVLTLRNSVGLHARPAALLARLASRYDAEVSVNDVDATSVLALMGLGLGQGEELRVRADGPDADDALAEITKVVEDGFGEE